MSEWREFEDGSEVTAPLAQMITAERVVRDLDETWVCEYCDEEHTTEEVQLLVTVTTAEGAMVFIIHPEGLIELGLAASMVIVGTVLHDDRKDTDG